MIHLGANEAAKILTPNESQHLHNQALLGIHCTYLGESLAGIVLFRDGAKPFTPDDAATLRAIAPVFAITLATMVRSELDEPGEIGDGEDADGPLMDEPDDSSPRRRKKDDSDWWKRGEPPPF